MVTADQTRWPSGDWGSSEAGLAGGAPSVTQRRETDPACKGLSLGRWPLKPRKVQRI